MNTDNTNNNLGRKLIKEGNEHQRKTIEEINRQLKEVARPKESGQGTPKSNGN